MALINCPDCQKEISDKAINCPNCGYPLHQTETQLQEISVPTFPVDLTIGGQFMNWGGDAAFKGDFRPEDNVVRTITPGGVHVILHKFGINITNSFFVSELELHNSQIISIDFADTSRLLREDKSVIGRAVVGGLLMGPMAAIIGGMSGIGQKTHLVNSGYLVVNYWDRFTKTAQTILIRGNEIDEIRAFVGRLNTERSKTQTPEQKKALDNINESDKKILATYQKEGLAKAINVYLLENKIDSKNSKGFEMGSKYVEGLAKSYGVKGKGGCFVATACYGDYDAPEVLVLRQFRDETLLQTFFGKVFVKFYYSVSPFFASLITKSELLKKSMRQYLLEPIVSKLKRHNRR